MTGGRPKEKGPQGSGPLRLELPSLAQQGDTLLPRGHNPLGLLRKHSACAEIETETQVSLPGQIPRKKRKWLLRARTREL